MKSFPVLLALLVSLSYAQMTNVQLFRVRFSDFKAEFTGNYQNRTRMWSSAQNPGEYLRNVSSGELQFTTQGSVYHPDLLSWTAVTNLGLFHTNVSQAAEISSGLEDWNLFRDVYFRSALLPKKSMNLNAYYTRKFQQLTRDYFNLVNVHVDQFTLQGNWRNKVVPFNLEYSQERNLETFGERYVKVSEKRWAASGDWGSLRANGGMFRYRTISLNRLDKGYYDLSQVSHNLTVFSRMLLGSEDQYKTQNRIVMNLVRGDQDITSILLTNTMQTDITDNLRANLTQASNYYKNPSNKLINYFIEGELYHKLYLSLVSRLKIKGDYVKEDSYRKYLVNGKLSLDYQKLLPLGKLFAGVGVHPKFEWIKNASGIVRFSETSHVFADQSTFFITQPGVQEESVQVLNSSRSIIYNRDVDYNLLPYGDYYQIMLIPGSAIDDSSEVIIQYVFEAPPEQNTRYTVWNYRFAYTITTFFDFTIEYNRLFSLFPEQNDNYWWVQNRENREQLRTRIDMYPFNLEVVREVSRSNLIPYRLTKVQGGAILGSYTSQYLLFRSQLGWQEYPLTSDYQEHTMYQLEYFRRLTATLRFRVRGVRRVIDGDLNQIREEKWDVVLKDDHRIWSAEIMYEWMYSSFSNEKEYKKRWVINFSVHP